MSILEVAFEVALIAAAVVALIVILRAIYESIKPLADELAARFSGWISGLWQSFTQSQTVSSFNQWANSVLAALAEQGHPMTEQAEVFTFVNRENAVATTVFAPDGKNAFYSEGFVTSNPAEAMAAHQHFLNQCKGPVVEFSDIVAKYSHL